MKLERKFFLKIFDDEKKEIFVYNKGQPLNYQEVKKHVLEMVTEVDPALFCGNFYVSISCESGQLFQYISYRWLVAQFAFDQSNTKKAFLALLDFLFIYGEWTNFHKIPKNLMNDLNEQIKKQKDESEQQQKNKEILDLDSRKESEDAIMLRGKPLSYWEEKQKEYDRQRLELIRN